MEGLFDAAILSTTDLEHGACTANQWLGSKQHTRHLSIPLEERPFQVLCAQNPSNGEQHVLALGRQSRYFHAAKKEYGRQPVCFPL